MSTLSIGRTVNGGLAGSQRVTVNCESKRDMNANVRANRIRTVVSEV